MDVMIVDDEPAARRTVRECCEREPDLRVIGEFGDPRAALEAIRSQHPHVLRVECRTRLAHRGGRIAVRIPACRPEGKELRRGLTPAGSYRQIEACRRRHELRLHARGQLLRQSAMQPGDQLLVCVNICW